jgi:hypothetical protein
MRTLFIPYLSFHLSMNDIFQKMGVSKRGHMPKNIMIIGDRDQVQYYLTILLDARDEKQLLILTIQ